MKRNSGMSMMEVMVAAAMIGGLALAGMKLMENQQKSTRSFEMRNEEINVVRNMQMALTDKDSCTLTFRNKEIGKEIDAIKNKRDKEIYTVGQTLGKNLLVIESMKTLNSDIPEEGGTGTFIFKVKLARKGLRKGESTTKTYGAQAVIKELMVNATADSSGKIVDCFSDQDATILTAKIEMCSVLGGSFNMEANSCTTQFATKAYVDAQINLLRMEVGANVGTATTTSNPAGLDLSSIRSAMKTGANCSGSAIRTRYKDTVATTCQPQFQYRSCVNGKWGDWSGTYTSVNCTKN